MIHLWDCSRRHTGTWGRVWQSNCNCKPCFDKKMFCSARVPSRQIYVLWFLLKSTLLFVLCTRPLSTCNASGGSTTPSLILLLWNLLCATRTSGKRTWTKRKGRRFQQNQLESIYLIFLSAKFCCATISDNLLEKMFVI